MDASFTALFKRGHYHRSGTKTTRERREVERFAVAALAFCLKHDEKFSREFLRQVCRFSQIHATTPVQYEVTIELNRKGPDLIVVVDAYNLCAVIEAKIWAKLKEHQDFRCKPSFCGPQGYGNWIRRHVNVPKGAEVVYLLLDSRQTAEEKTIAINGRLVRCRMAKWERLPFSDGSLPILADFRECLAGFGVSVLALEATKHMKIDKNVVVGAKAWKVLWSVCQALQFQSGKLRQDIAYETEDDWHFGCSIEAPTQKDYKKGNHGKLKNLVGARTGTLGWIGYQTVDAGGIDISVWFYCVAKDNAKSIQKMLLRSGVASALADDVYVEVKTAHGSMQAGAAQDWFLSVFKAVGIEHDR